MDKQTIEKRKLELAESLQKYIERIGGTFDPVELFHKNTRLYIKTRSLADKIGLEMDEFVETLDLKYAEKTSKKKENCNK